MKYVVILNRYGSPMFLVDDNEDAMLYDTHKDAYHAAEGNALGYAAGYDIIEWNYVKNKSHT